MKVTLTKDGTEFILPTIDLHFKEKEALIGDHYSKYIGFEVNEAIELLNSYF